MFALQALNAIVGNALDSPVLEWALGGGTLRFPGDCVLAIGGAHARATLAGKTVPSFTTCYARDCAAGSSTNLTKISAALLKVSIPGLSGTYKLASDRSAIIGQAQCSVSVKGPGVISNYVIKP